MFKANQQIGPYKLVRKLGTGTYGTVWLAERKTSFVTTYVAIKTFNTSSDNIASILKEARLLALISGHPNVLMLLDADIYEGISIIVTEYVQGGSLEDWLGSHDGKAPTIQDAISIAICILKGLSHIHSAGIIHRDLKPANVMLQHGIPKIADFGVSRLIESTSPSLTPRGSVPYMAPEAWEGERSIQTDLWAMGVILYEMLDGNRPFIAASQLAYIWAVQNPARPISKSVPSVLTKIIAKALAKRPIDRFRTADDMVRDLESASNVIEKVTKFTNIPKDYKIRKLLTILFQIGGNLFIAADTANSKYKRFIESCNVPASVSVLGLINTGHWFFWMPKNRFILFTENSMFFRYDRQILEINYMDMMYEEFSYIQHRESTGRQWIHWKELTFGSKSLLDSISDSDIDAFFSITQMIKITFFDAIE